MLIKTFDIIDGIKTISQLEYDASSGYETIQEVQFGTDSGLEHRFTIKKDYLNNKKLLKGKKYLFSISAYASTSDESKKIKSIESSVKLFDFLYRYNEYGFNYGENFNVEHTQGNSNAEINVNVFDSDLVNGNSYELYFTKQNYYLGSDGNWSETDIIDTSNNRTEYHWNVKNSITNKIVLKNQRIFNGIDIYSEFWNTPSITNNPVIDGVEISVEGSFYNPVEIYDVDQSNAHGYYRINDFGTNSWAATGRSVDAFGNGTKSYDVLQKDYELRFTGVLEAPNANGVIHIKEGTGSMATLYGARNYSIKDHPMNPNPGSGTPFLVRIPFEIWNIDDNQQVNLLVYDRKQKITDNPFFAFNPDDRMHCEINNTPYSSDIVNSADSNNTDTDNLTWNLIFWKTNWLTDDVVKLIYYNPIEVEIDKYSFTTFSLDGNKKLTNYSLSQNFPNLFNPSTKINFTVVQAGLVNLRMYDILGREVVVLLNKHLEAGKYTINFNASVSSATAGSLASGVYFYRISVADFVDVKKMLLLR